jgi:type II secretory pathway predicted ATPase ExeA
VNTDDALQHFGLFKSPFAHRGGHIDFYAGPQHRDAVSFLERALHSNDLMLALTGEHGSGKSVALDFALKQTVPGAVVATLKQVSGEPEEFLGALLKGFGFEGVTASPEEMRGLLSVYFGHLRQKGVTAVIVADRLNTVPGVIMEEVGWLSLLEPVRLGRLKLALLGSERLERQLAAPRMHAVRQMIRWQHRLEPLGVNESRDYLEFHLEAAGCKKPGEVFTPDAIARIHAHAGGLPGRIDIIAERALELSSEAGDKRVKGEHVHGLGGARGGDRPPPRRVASLDIMLESEPKARIRLNHPRLLIGRHPWNDVQLDHDSVSRHHAMLVREGGHWTVVDLNSTNGIRVNDRAVRQQRLRNGDVVHVGRFQLVLNEGMGPQASLPTVADVGDTAVLPDK